MLCMRTKECDLLPDTVFMHGMILNDVSVIPLTQDLNCRLQYTIVMARDRVIVLMSDMGVDVRESMLTFRMFYGSRKTMV